MTADIELLPLPEWTKRDDLGGLVPSEVRVEMQSYARACVEANTEALRKLCRDMLPVFEAARPLVLNLERLRDAAKEEGK